MKVLALVVLMCLSASAFSRSLDSSFEVHSRSLLTDDAPTADLNRFFERGLLEDAPFRALYDTATFHRAQFPIEKPFFAQDLISIAPAVQGPGGNITAWTLGQNPALYELGATGNGRGMAQARASFNPCGLNLPHVHPRGIEFIHVLYGEIQFTFFEENGGRVITLDLSEGMSTFVPTGLYHTSHNLKCDPAAFLATFNHNDPGTSTILQQHVNLPLPTLSTTFGGAFTDDQLNDIKEVVTNTINFAQGPAECLERCGISHP